MTNKLNAAMACAVTMRQLNDGKTIRNATEHMVMVPDSDSPRPMTGFFNTLTPEQKKVALETDDSDVHTYYDPTIKEQVVGFWESSTLMYPDSKLKEQVRSFEDTPSVFDVLAEAFGFKKASK